MDDTTAIYKQSSMNMTAFTSELGKKEIIATILLATVAIHGPVLVLSARQRRSANRASRFLLWSLSAAYFPLMTSVLSYLSTFIPSSGGKHATAILVLVILVQFLRAKTDMAALAVAAVASPAAGDDGVNSLKIRPPTDSFINTFWVAALVTYNIFSTIVKQSLSTSKGLLLFVVTMLVSPLWALGACRMVLRFVTFQRATSSFALGRNVQLVDGYMMLQLREEVEREMAAVPAAQPQQVAAVVPRLIVTGERNKDVDKTPLGFQVKPSSLQGVSGQGSSSSSSRLVTLDRVWKSGHLLPREKDLCLSFALFKCLRRRFAGDRLAAEAGSSWAFRFVCEGLLLGCQQEQNDDERVFRVIGTELWFASDFFHSALPVASMGTTAAALHFVLSLLIFPSFLLLGLGLLVYPIVVYPTIVDSSAYKYYTSPLVLLEFVLTLVNAYLEIREMVASVRSNWTKISIIGHIVRSRHHETFARRFLAWLVRRCNAREFWHDKIRQMQMLKRDDLLVVQYQPCACSRRLRDLIGVGWRKNDDDSKIKVPLAVKEALLRSLKEGGGQLSDGTAAIRRHPLSRGNSVTWACHGGDGDTTTDAILVWHIATTLFDMKCRRRSSGSAAASPSPSPSTTLGANDVDRKSKAVVVACRLSCYCMYLVAQAPELLPDNSAWITSLYEDVKKRVEKTPKCSGDKSSLYQHLLNAFSENSNSHEVLINGAKLAKQLEKEADEDKVWALLSDFWSEMVLYLAPSDNVKAHIEALQRGGELITLLWALLQHAGITSRPVEDEYNFTA